MIETFLTIVEEKNPYQGKYLKIAMVDITKEEIKKLEKLIEFYLKKGNSIEEIVVKYLDFIDSLLDEQKYFLENKSYRFSKFREVADLYNNIDYMDSYVIGLGLSTYLWHIHRGMMRFFVGKCKELHQGMKYLEIGPGHGEYFVTAIENTYFDEYMAVDISETSVDMTREFCEYCLGKDSNKNYKILNKDFFEFTNDNKFDAVVMGEVLEHVEEPHKFLKKIYDIANEDAFIYITTAINAPQPDHIYHFKTLEQVADLFKKCGLKIVNEIALTANNVSIEKAVKKKYAIVVGYVLKKEV